MKIVYIDAQNIHKSIKIYHNWIIDREKFFRYCKEKFTIDDVKIFFWYIAKYKYFYQYLQKIWYTIHFKETLILPDWTTKWNVDIDIAIIWLRDVYEKTVSKAYIVTWDGDYNSLIDFWIEKQIFWRAILPGIKNSSKLLMKSAKKDILDLIPLQKKLQKENPGNTS